MVEFIMLLAIAVLIIAVTASHFRQLGFLPPGPDHSFLETDPAAPASPWKSSLAERQRYLEFLLAELDSAKQCLIAALDDEERFGERALATEPGEWDSAIAMWQDSRSQVDHHQAVYCKAAREYRLFAEQLPPRMRSKAVERGAEAMTLRHA